MRAWERLEGETAKAYEAFQIYRDMGIERSIAKVAKELGKSVGLLHQWSSRHDWVARVQALEDYHSMLVADAIEKRAKAQAETIAEKQARLREMLLDNGFKAAEMEARMLDWPLARQTATEFDEEGRPTAYTVEPTNWNKGTAKLYHDIASKAAGEPEKFALTDASGEGEWGKSREEMEAELAILLDKALAATEEPEDG